VRVVVLVMSCGLGLLATAGLAAASPPSTDPGIAAAGVVAAQDFPAGWAPTARSGSGGSADRLVASAPACKQFKPLLGSTKTAAQVRSPASYSDGAVTVANTVTVYPDLRHADVPFAAIKSGAFSKCLQQVLKQGVRAQLARSASVPGAAGRPPAVQIEVAAGSAKPGTTVGDDQTAFTETLTLSRQGGRRTLYFEDVLIRVGRAIDSFSYQSDAAPIADTLNGVVSASVGRLAAAINR
jgi:hypothetical protein